MIESEKGLGQEQKYDAHTSIFKNKLFRLFPLCCTDVHLKKNYLDCFHFKLPYYDTLKKLIKKFWVELMLFVAPSHDETADAEHLATGREFVTHLWAHAGKLKRNPAQDV